MSSFNATANLYLCSIGSRDKNMPTYLFQALDVVMMSNLGPPNNL